MNTEETVKAIFGKSDYINKLWSGEKGPPMTALEWPMCPVCYKSFKRGTTKCPKHPNETLVSGDL